MLHNIIEMLHKNSPNSPLSVYCEYCDYTCVKNSDMNKHLSTYKHKCNKNGNICNIKLAKNEFICNICNKIYKSRVGLWRHNKICIMNNDTFQSINENDGDNQKTDQKENEINRLTTLMIELIKSNSELQKQMIETTNHTNHISNSNNTMNNSNNKTFNLQVFLNEHCKDAMNLSDFIESIQLNLTDLENMEKLGYTDCMFNNIFGNMNILEICARPFHCSDLKREIMYIKDNDIWEKEDAEHSKLKNAIRTIEKKNFKLLNEWTNKHPTFKDYDSPYNDKYLKIVGQTMSGDKEHMIKVIRKLAKNCVIDKNSL